MIYDLEILNGNLELKFNEYIYDYTVKVKDDITSLDFSYKLLDDTFVEIINNNIEDDETLITLKVYNVDKEVEYHFLVTKEKEEDVSLINKYKESLEVKEDDNLDLKVEVLGISIILLIIILFSLIFSHRKRNN